ncbi:MAG: hypothetical protein U0572_05175 [Phycisphaerales bacterium]
MGLGALNPLPQKNMDADQSVLLTCDPPQPVLLSSWEKGGASAPPEKSSMLLGRERGWASSEEGVEMAAVQRWFISSGCACAVIALAGASANADTNTVPNLMLNVGNGISSYSFNAASTGNSWSNGNSTFGYEGTVTSPFDGAGFTLSWGLLVNPDPFIVGNLVVTNTSASTQTFFLDVALPIGAPLASTLIGGSITGTVTDLTGDGATVAAVSPNDSIYRALTDVDGGFNGNLAGTLLTGASASAGSFGSATIGPAAFGTPIPSQPYGAVTTNIAIRLAFTLTAGDSASFTSLFVVIPAPAGAFAMLGLMGVGGRRRRA